MMKKIFLYQLYITKRKKNQPDLKFENDLTTCACKNLQSVFEEKIIRVFALIFDDGAVNAFTNSMDTNQKTK